MRNKKTAVLPAAGKSTLQIEPYQNGNSLSSRKLQIGELLLFGNRQHRGFWNLFEILLRQYLVDKK